MVFLNKTSLLKSDLSAGQVLFDIDGKHELSIECFEGGLFHVLFRKNKSLLNRRTWSVAPGLEDIPFEGRTRESCEDLSVAPILQLDNHSAIFSAETGTVRFEVHSSPLQIKWFLKKNNHWVPLIQDRNTNAYAFARKSDQHWHFLNRDKELSYYGLGEKSGALEKTGLHYEMRNLDAMGYDAESSDPLYKHIPFFIGKRESVGSFGYFYDNLATSHFDFGKELDNYHGHFSSYKAETGDLDYYFFAGETVADITKKMSWLTGKTIFPPKWSLGYSGSTMFYTDQPKSQELMGEFIDDLNSASLPANSFQLSSGYTSIKDKRYVFHWNTEKFPDPEGFVESYNKAGLKIAANIKPVLLKDHPLYDEAREKQLFIKNPETHEPETSMFWDAEGSHLDFTNKETIRWWKSNVKRQLLEKGIESTWNDNNEYEIWDSEAQCNGFGEALPISQVRPLHPFLMMKSSYEAQIEHSPNKRPWLISRCGQPGMQKYVQTWSGDNYTEWKTIKYNQIMGMNLSLSGVYNFGHDVGGFSGPAPEPELLVRWIQNGIFHPRFTIHSWNDDDSVTEPWMYPEVLPYVQEAFKLRYSLIPYLYKSLWKSTTSYEPLVKPLLYDFPEDTVACQVDDQFLLGTDLLIATVIEKGQSIRKVYLPKNKTGWCDFNTGEWFESGQFLDVPCEDLATIPIFVRAGSFIPMGDATSEAAEIGTKNLKLVYFSTSKESEEKTVHYDDDGVSHNWKSGEHLWVEFTVKETAEIVQITTKHAVQEWKPNYKTIELVAAGAPAKVFTVNGKKQNSILIDDFYEE